jgi:hypothetical protein
VADTKISALSALTGANLASGDQLVAVDVSDTTMAASGTDKAITASELAQGVFLLRSGKTASRHLPTSAVAATFDRAIPTSSQTPLTAGTLFLAGISLEAGQVINNISFKSGSSAASSPTHQWFGIADPSRAVQRWTSDDTTTAWGATTVKTLNLTSAYTVPTSDTYYLAIMVSGTTAPTLLSIAAVNANISNIAPTLMGNTTDTGLTTPPTLAFTAGAITAGTSMPYAWVA